jgi:hypothetical protein
MKTEMEERNEAVNGCGQADIIYNRLGVLALESMESDSRQMEKTSGFGTPMAAPRWRLEYHP